MSDENKKCPTCGQEVSDDELDQVAGGRYSKEEWASMTLQEKCAAQGRSQQARLQNRACELD